MVCVGEGEQKQLFAFVGQSPRERREDGLPVLTLCRDDGADDVGALRFEASRDRVRDISDAVCRVPDALLCVRRDKVRRGEHSGDRRLRNARLCCHIVRCDWLTATRSPLWVIHGSDGATSGDGRITLRSPPVTLAKLNDFVVMRQQGEPS